MPDKPINESGRFAIVANRHATILVDTWWGSAWRLYGDKWKYIPFDGAVPARIAPEDVPENFNQPDVSETNLSSETPPVT